MSDDFEKVRLEQSIRELKEREKRNAERTQGIVFLAIWVLPLFGMNVLAGNYGPLSALWFLGVPIAFWLYWRYKKSKGE